jgi:transmembrane sensor
MLTGPDQPPEQGDRALNRVRDEALDWMRRLGCGEVTQADLDALDRWRMASPAHRRAFAEAHVFWDVLGKVAEEAHRRGHKRHSAPALPNRSMGRRTVLTGAAAAAMAYVVVRPPLGLWPSMAEFAADYRTATGEQKRIDVAAGIIIEMNTQTSLTAPVTVGQRLALELVAGEVDVSVGAAQAQPLCIAAAGGRIDADRANFNVRCDGPSVRVTCTEGAVRVTGRSAVTTLVAGQQVSYGDGMQETAAAVDTTVVTAWKRGMLIFRNAPLPQVIAELNRYRPGKIILLNKGLAKRTVVAGFRLDQIGEAVRYLGLAVGAEIRSLPGGVVLLS